MSWLTIDEFLENNIDKIRSIITYKDDELLKQYEKTPKLYVEKLNELCETSWYYRSSINMLYSDYKLDVTPEWQGNLVHPQVLNSAYYEKTPDYQWLVFNISNTTLHCTTAKKWGIRVNSPTCNVNLYRYHGLYIYELVGLQGTTVTLQQIRERVNHVHKWCEIVCLK